MSCGHCSACANARPLNLDVTVKLGFFLLCVCVCLCVCLCLCILFVYIYMDLYCTPVYLKNTLEDKMYPSTRLTVPALPKTFQTPRASSSTVSGAISDTPWSPLSNFFFLSTLSLCFSPLYPSLMLIRRDFYSYPYYP